MIPGFGAAEANLRGTDPRASQLGDIITQVDGEAVETFRELRLVLDRYAPGDEVEVTTWREGETETQTVVLR